MNTLKFVFGLILVALLASVSACAPTQAPSIALAPTVLSTPISTTQALAAPRPTATPPPSPVEFVWRIAGEPNAFVRPATVAVDEQSNIYVVDGGNHRIQKFDTDGKFLTMWGSQGNGDGQFVFLIKPEHYGAVAVDRQGNVYVTDYNNRVQKFDGNGKFLMKWGSQGNGDGQFASHTTIAVDNLGNVYVADRENYRIQKFDNGGKFITKWGSRGSEDGQFGANPQDSGPGAIATDGQGNVYVADPGNYRIEKFDSNGKFITKWGSSGTGDGQFKMPQGIAVDQQGSVFVTDNSAHRVLQFDGQGKFLSQWGNLGTTPGMLYYPGGIAIDHQDNIYVVNVIENVQKFRPH